MQQDSNALFSQSLGASSNFYFSDHDLCLLVTWSPCQVYGLLLSNQSEPPNVHKNWIPSQGKTKYVTSVSLSCILNFRAIGFKIEIFFVCDVYRTFVPIKFSYISPYKHYEMAFALVPHSCQNLHFKSCLLILWKRRSTADGYFNNIESALLHPNNSVWAQNDPFCSMLL